MLPGSYQGSNDEIVVNADTKENPSCHCSYNNSETCYSSQEPCNDVYGRSKVASGDLSRHWSRGKFRYKDHQELF